MGTNAWQESPRVAAMLDRISKLIEQAAPRRVPSDVWRRARSPIAMFLLGMGIFFAAFAMVMVVALRADRAQWPLLAAVAWLPLAVALISLYSLVVTRKTLSAGHLYKGKVLTVKPLPAMINGRIFSLRRSNSRGPAAPGSGARTRLTTGVRIVFSPRETRGRRSR